MILKFKFSNFAAGTVLISLSNPYQGFSEVKVCLALW